MQTMARYLKWVVMSNADDKPLNDEGYAVDNLAEAKFYDCQQDVIDVINEAPEGELSVCEVSIIYNLEVE